jgi:hypothetical protein
MWFRVDWCYIEKVEIILTSEYSLIPRGIQKEASLTSTETCELQKAYRTFSRICLCIS